MRRVTASRGDSSRGDTPRLVVWIGETIMTWQTKLAAYMGGGATAAEAFDAIASDLETMRDASLALSECPEEARFLRELYAEDSATLATLRAAHVETAGV